MSGRWRVDNGGFKLLPAQGGWGLGFESWREGDALSFCPSFFLHLFCEWVPQPLLIRLSFMESQALSAGDGNPGTWQRPHDLPAPRCLSSLLFPSLFSSTFILLWLLSIFLSFTRKKKNKKVSPSISGKTKSVRCTKCRRREKKEQDLFMEKINVFVQGIKRELKRERERGSSLIARRRKYKSPLFFLLFVFLSSV